MGVGWSNMQGEVWRYSLEVQTLNIFVNVMTWSILWTPWFYEQTNNLSTMPSFGFVVSSIPTPDSCDKELKSFPQIIYMCLR
jgi:hypothetical protein